MVHVRIELPKSVADTWREAAELQQRAAAAERRAAELRRQSVRTLVGDEGLSQAEAGRVLGLSYQRIQQLAKTRP